MKALIHENGNLNVLETAEPVAKLGEVVVAMHAAGLNRRDLMIPGRRGNTKEPLILGSDGAGVISSIGKGVKGWSVGDEVIINPSLRWFDKSTFPPAGFDILGMPDHGTFAEKIAISAEQLEKKPANLSMEEAAVIALSALTGYRALFTQGELKPGHTVFIPGAGSGVATYIIQFAKNIGARVIVSSRSVEKRKKALELGADLAIDTNDNWLDALSDEKIDVVIESVGRATFNRSLEVLKPGGRIVVFGATTEDVVDLDLRKFFYGQYQMFGSTMGSRDELREMLQHIDQYGVKPVIDKAYPLENALEAFDALRNSEQFGKLVLQIKQ
ncbi:zinc-binding dehydrogenase [Sporosarcina sp. Sa2YVA2]|uniref:Zinc-binding dehydrogenase n=1 Tax=Sporosarcina quadrami TaxID=2762234 RepID=A0ABR8U958_9BACL|nr:zinc-binding dehydrogenase [Sporosarcina quadrami]MBD7984253.1 zinc-binding dehydrogenase [Sporosarcina quadrami]